MDANAIQFTACCVPQRSAEPHAPQINAQKLDAAHAIHRTPRGT